jgi:C1A family cysteine protease
MVQHAFGWKKQKPDPRDYSINHPQVRKFFLKLKEVPKSVSWRNSPNMPPIVDQGQLGSCTANAAACLIDYCEHKTNGQFLTPSRLFEYWNTEIEDGADPTQDNGATIRSALKAIGDYGAIPESWMPYHDSMPLISPTQDDFDEGKKYKATKYVLIDQPGMNPTDILAEIKSQLAQENILDFGSPVYQQIYSVGSDGNVTMPASGERSIGGHSMCIIGYDDAHDNADGTKGAFEVRNSWGTAWGDNGYCWMPYGYVLQGSSFPDGLISDIWDLESEDWAQV